MKATLRITGGSYRGRRIQCPPGEIRPAMDRMRESLFSILGNLSGESFLDLFTGSGVIALEAASRGAEPVIAVEKDQGKREVLLRNLAIAEGGVRAFFQPAERFIRTSRDRFAYIFLDPPFAYGYKLQLIEEIDRRGLLAPDGILMLHYPREERFPERIGGLGRKDLRRYGRSELLFMTYLSVDDVHPSAPSDGE